MDSISNDPQDKDYRIPFQPLSVDAVHVVTNDNVNIGFETSLNFRPHSPHHIDLNSARDLLTQKVQSGIDNIVGCVAFHEFLAKPDLLRNEFYHADNIIGKEMGLEIQNFKL
jgi:regulator of protease activity HflC (stomatin/prohibitin superfamily)